MPVEHRRIPAHRVAEPANGQSLHAVAIDDPQRGLQDQRAADLSVVLAGGAAGRGIISAPTEPGQLSRHRSSPSAVNAIYEHQRLAAYAYVVDACPTPSKPRQTPHRTLPDSPEGR